MQVKAHHQAFVIVRYGRGNYRCVAAYDHPCCRGPVQPLRAVRRMLDLVRQPDNAQIVRYELKSAHEQLNLFSRAAEIPDDPCPYIRMLLSQAFSAELASGNEAYWHMSHGDELGASISAFDAGECDSQSHFQRNDS
jgi:hypothetical protein